MNMDDYTTLGRSGLRVSSLCLGAMTFGTEWGIGVEEAGSRAIFNHTSSVAGILWIQPMVQRRKERRANREIYHGAKSRDRVVLATKFTFNAEPGNPNAGGNGRKNIYRALQGSLRRLQTDYIDLYWLHAWDTVTPVEEVISTLNDLVREGRILHYGFSDTPAWYVARAQTLAEKEGKERLIALQLEYSLVERNTEREHVPVAQELGIGICPWSPLASGFLSGKYKREGGTWRGDGRLQTMKDSPNPVFSKFTERNARVLDALISVAQQLNKTPAQVALNWAATQPGITSTIIGATKVAHLDDNLSCLDFSIPSELRSKLDQASALESVHPYVFFEATLQGMISGGTSVNAWSPAHVYRAPVGEKPRRRRLPRSGPTTRDCLTI